MITIFLTVIAILSIGSLAVGLHAYWTTDREPTEAEKRPPSPYQLRQDAELRAAQKACAEFQERP